MASTAEQLKKPTTAYFLWLADNRERIAKEIGTAKGPEVAKRAGEIWKTAPSTEKAPYEAKAAKQKEDYQKFIATEDGKNALQAKKAEKATEKAEKSAKATKIALKSVEKDDALKKPQSAYWMWLEANRERIGKECGTKAPTVVAKRAGEQWKALPADQKAPFETKAKEQKEAYDKYLASEEGAAKLQAFKDARNAVKDAHKPPSPKTKRGADGAEPAAKRGRTAKSDAAVAGA